MNIYEAMKIVSQSGRFQGATPTEIAALIEISQAAEAYDALPPKNNEWPDDAQWYAIDANEEATWFEVKPKMYSNSWWDESGWPDEYGKAIPSGVDWRLCLWKRPEVIE